MGNLFAAASFRNCKIGGLGPFLSRWSDAEILEFFGDYLDASSLCTVSKVSRAMYVYGTHDALWKVIALKRFKGDFRFVGSTWRETYAAALAGSAEVRTSHRPICVEGFCSDIMFRPFLCASSPIMDTWIRVDNVQRKDELSEEAFLRDYGSKNRPVVLTGITDKWPAMKRWTDEYMLQQSNGRTFDCGGFKISFRNYARYAKARKPFEDQPLYLFDSHFCEKVPALGRDYTPPTIFGEDLFALLGDARPDFRWLIVGPARSASLWHQDPNGTSAWNAVVRGAKRWIMLPPHISPPGVHPSKDGAEVSQPVSLLEWYNQFYDMVDEDVAVQFTARPGDLVYVPRGWWHAVLNLEDTIAVTQNFVSHESLSHVLHFLRRKSDQVSGCCDGANAGLYDRFTRALRSHRPKLLERVEAERKKREASNFSWSAITQDTRSKISVRTGDIPEKRSDDSERVVDGNGRVTNGGFSFNFSFDEGGA